MKRLGLPLMSKLNLATAALLVAWLSASAWAQNSSKGAVATKGIVTDWSTPHVIFSDPGTLMNAMMKGKRAQWERIVNDPRYQMQQLRRGQPVTGQTATSTVGLPRAQQVVRTNSNVGGQNGNSKGKGSGKNPSKVDWSVPLAPSGSTGGVSEYASPAKYSFTDPDPITAGNCRETVVFPVGNISGSSTQASLIGVTNIYRLCPGGPAIRFAYHFQGGEVDNSPVISLEGTHVAFVESHPGGGSGALFHVLTLAVNGDTGNGTAFDAPAVPGTGNTAVDTTFPLAGTGIKSGIYVDYTGDTAYVTDDAGFVHKYNTVFEGTPSEDANKDLWPVDLSATEPAGLSAPVFDGQSQHLFFIGISSGTLYCYNPDGSTCGNLVMGSTPGQIQTFVPPIVDSTRGTVFAYGNGLSVISPNVLVQASSADLSLESEVNVGSSLGNLARGAFDNAYLTDPASGHLYLGGGQISDGGTLALRRVGFDSSGIMTADETNSFVLQTGSPTGAGVAVVSQASVGTTSGNNCTITGLNTAVATPGGLILVGLAGSNANSATNPTVTGGGSPTVTSIFSNYSTNAKIQIWSITGFTPGSTPSITIDTSGAAGVVCGAVAFSGVASVGTVVAASGATNSPQPSVTLTDPGPGGAVFDILSTGGGGAEVVTPAAGQVPQWNLVGGGNRDGAASVASRRSTMSWTMSSSQAWYLAAVPLVAIRAPQQTNFTSLLDVFNTSDSTERLFLGVQNFGFDSSTAPSGPNCDGNTCVISFDTTSGTFPTAASATLEYPTATNQLLSDIIIDNVSTGGSNIYYGVNNQGIQVTQAALQ